jgi:recombinational DNA repair ATPase RecF
MERSYVDHVRVNDFRCVRQADLHLTPLHALIGPNDSGKSSILQAILHAHRTLFWINSTGAAWSRTGCIRRVLLR